MSDTHYTDDAVDQSDQGSKIPTYTIHRRMFGPGIYGKDDAGRAWATCECVNHTETCAACGATISKGWRCVTDDFMVCGEHVVSIEQAVDSAAEQGHQAALLSRGEARQREAAKAWRTLTEARARVWSVVQESYWLRLGSEHDRWFCGLCGSVGTASSEKAVVQHNDACPVLRACTILATFDGETSA